jgi:transcriptional regulator with XRE-family HTH domain
MADQRKVSSLLSSKLLGYLIAQGHSQADVARILGVSEGFVSLVKSQRRSLTLDHVEAAAEGIQMSLGELLIQATEPRKASKKAAGMLRVTSRLIRKTDQMRTMLRREAVKK